MKQYQNAQEIQAELGVRPQDAMQQFPEGNAARMGMLGLGAQGSGSDQESQASEEQEAGSEVDGGSSEQGQGAGAPGEMEALHSSEDHEYIGGKNQVAVGPHVLTTGQVNMLVDYVTSLQELVELSQADLVEGFALIHLNEHGHMTPEQSARFEEIFPNYADIALDNSDHFAPPSNGVAPAGSANFLGQIREHLAKAHEQASAGDLNAALGTAGWGGHYIADAFSAGHLINKDEIMFKADVHLMAYGETPVFSHAARGIVAEGEAVSGWAQRTPLGNKPLSAAFLVQLLSLANVFEHTAITGAVAKAIHDELSGDPGRPIIEVSSMGQKWLMGGDENLDDTSKDVAKDLIDWVYESLGAQADSQDHISADAMIQWVEQRLPQPTADGQARIDQVVSNVFANAESLGTALAEATVSEFDAIMENFDATPIGALIVRVAPEGDDELSAYPTPDVRDALEREGITDTDVEAILERFQEESQETVLSDYGLSVDQVLEPLTQGA